MAWDPREALRCNVTFLPITFTYYLDRADRGCTLQSQIAGSCVNLTKVSRSLHSTSALDSRTNLSFLFSWLFSFSVKSLFVAFDFEFRFRFLCLVLLKPMTPRLVSFWLRYGMASSILHPFCSFFFLSFFSLNFPCQYYVIL